MLPKAKFHFGSCQKPEKSLPRHMGQRKSTKVKCAIFEKLSNPPAPFPIGSQHWSWWSFYLLGKRKTIQNYLSNLISSKTRKGNGLAGKWAERCCVPSTRKYLRGEGLRFWRSVAPTSLMCRESECLQTDPSIHLVSAHLALWMCRNLTPIFLGKGLRWLIKMCLDKVRHKGQWSLRSSGKGQGNSTPEGTSTDSFTVNSKQQPRGVSTPSLGHS